ncbi:DUF4011 domain-containing protein [Granulosicoccaceae sp. 1_MG-2023]|nr:DUF4011 domain-containing protein [Granulosicoccaceae sp. 1_MG-2023]
MTPTSNSGQNKNNAGSRDEDITDLLPYLNWSRAAYALELHSTAPETFSHKLQNARQMVIGLSGCDLQEIRSPVQPQAMQFDEMLSSTHRAALLKRHCDKIIMSTALVKSRGDKQLYLATDFLRWQDQESGLEYSAPLILYPVQIFYNDHPSHPVENFLLYSDTQAPMENKPLLAKLRDTVSDAISDFDPLNQQAFLLSVAVALQSHPEFSLRRKIALNVLPTAMPGTHGFASRRNRRAEDRDLNWDVAYGLIRERSVSDLRTVMSLLEESPACFTTDDSAALCSKELEERAGVLVSLGLDTLNLHHLTGLPDHIESWVNTIDAVSDNSLLQEIARSSEMTVAVYAGLAESLAMMDKLPSSDPAHYHPDHAYKNCLPTLQRAKFQYRLINTELDSLKTFFNLDPFPDPESLKELCEILDAQRECASAVVDTRYFHARKTLSALLVSGKAHYGENEELHLKRLVKILRLRDLFAQNSEYKLAFGKLFKGMATDWQLLESHIVFSRKLAEPVHSESVAAFLLQQWNTIGLSDTGISPQLQAASKATRRLMRLLQIPADSEMTIDQLIVLARELAPRLQALSPAEAPDELMGRLSAQVILDTTRMLRESRERYKALPEEERAAYRETIDATLAWMADTLRQENVKLQDIRLLLNRIAR